MKTIGKVLLLVMICAKVFSQNYLEFVENKGQWGKDVKFKGDMSTGSFLLQSSGYRVVLYNKDDLAARSASIHRHPETVAPAEQQSDSKVPAQQVSKPGEAKSGVLRGHIYEMRFLNANKNAQVVPEKPLESISNYFIGTDSTQWGRNCKTYTAITYKNVYPHIDVRYYTANGVLKYDFIVWMD